jgi:hypothetical protein
MKTDLTALEEIRRTEDPECLYWSYPRFKAARGTDEPVDNFPDPSDHLIGFVVATKQPLQSTANRLTQQSSGVELNSGKIVRVRHLRLLASLLVCSQADLDI